MRVQCVLSFFFLLNISSRIRSPPCIPLPSRPGARQGDPGKGRRFLPTWDRFQREYIEDHALVTRDLLTFSLTFSLSPSFRLARMDERNADKSSPSNILPLLVRHEERRLTSFIPLK